MAYTNSMNFGVNLLPTTDNEGTLGASDKQWILFAKSINLNDIDITTLINATKIEIVRLVT